MRQGGRHLPPLKTDAIAALSPAGQSPPRPSFKLSWTSSSRSMAAPQIPHLNLLRKGRGRGRGSGDGSDNAHSFRTPGKDRIVQSTDGDASVSRLSAVQLKYLEDRFATALTPPNSAQRRLPIINRGEIAPLLFLKYKANTRCRVNRHLRPHYRN